MYTVTLAAAGCLPDSEFYPVEFETIEEAWGFVVDQIEETEFDADYYAMRSALSRIDRNQPGSIPAGKDTTYAYTVDRQHEEG